ncbi:MAG: myo-inosose-2 dehydratase [Rhodospirillales bacterium]|nr:myo-inosose-2 dehydratase [Rhodospirillales bacterium]
MSCPIGINPLTWTNDDMPELGGETPLATCLSEAKRAGYDGVELGNKFPREAAKLSPIMAAHGLRIASGWYSANLLERDVDAEMAAMRPHLELLLAMGCKAMVFAETTGCVHGNRKAKLASRRRLSDAEMRLLGTRMTELGTLMEARGIKLAYHHHMGTVIETEAEIDALIASTGPSVGLLLDTGHLTFAGGDPLAVAKRHGRRIVHVHCKDIRAPLLAEAKAKDLSFLDAVLSGVFTVPGDGSVAYPPIFAELKRLKYSGWLVVEAEQDPAKAHPLTYAKMGNDYLRAQTAAIGL